MSVAPLSAEIIGAQKDNFSAWGDFRGDAVRMKSLRSERSTQSLTTKLKQSLINFFNYIQYKFHPSDVNSCRYAVGKLVTARTNQEFGHQLANLSWSLRSLPSLQLIVEGETITAGEAVDTDRFFKCLLKEKTVTIKYGNDSAIFESPEITNGSVFFESYNQQISALKRAEDQKLLLNRKYSKPLHPEVLKDSRPDCYRKLENRLVREHAPSKEDHIQTSEEFSEYDEIDASELAEYEASRTADTGGQSITDHSCDEGYDSVSSNLSSENSLSSEALSEMNCSVPAEQHQPTPSSFSSEKSISLKEAEEKSWSVKSAGYCSGHCSELHRTHVSDYFQLDAKAQNENCKASETSSDSPHKLRADVVNVRKEPLSRTFGFESVPFSSQEKFAIHVNKEFKQAVQNKAEIKAGELPAPPLVPLPAPPIHPRDLSRFKNSQKLMTK
ncbi:hypothetical protein JQC92_06025 [Shewanella sp. 202IG2-18]|uniref:hypothetical protein n=1 Tax=Parashewanella hymeniacidonis TaxID=2807618 RepID=UPI00195F91FC|nr:hypothetical protein [Parashewanella hymeniacidonis]MBM7071598.1 hypothetical protein [Parashewanella hymeniacidonis]